MPLTTNAADISVVAIGCRMQNSEMFIAAHLRIGLGQCIGGSAFAVTSRCTDFGHASAVDEAHLPLDNDSLPFVHSRAGERHDHLRWRRLEPCASPPSGPGFATKTNGPRLAALDGDRRDERSLRPDIEIDFDIDVHPGPQFQGFVGKDGFGGNGSGRGIDGAVDEIKLPGGERLVRSRHVNPHGRRHTLAQCLAKGREIALGKRESHADGRDLRDGQQSGGIIHADEVSRCHPDGPDAAIDRRFDLGVSKP